MRVGVLALQGDFREHLNALHALEAPAILVRDKVELDQVDALVIPGGESTTIAKLARSFDLFDPLHERILSGMPTYGSCAGMILIADRLVGSAPDQETFGGIDMTVRRNAFGRQVDSFEADLAFSGIETGPVRGIFIRAPWVEEVGPAVKVLAIMEMDGALHPVAVRQGHLLATSFHPEISGDNRVHQYFLEEVCYGVRTHQVRG
jgi:5'-phosphate synthase pdxT subunit